MHPNKETIINFALKLRQQGQIIDRSAFNQIAEWEHLEDCMQIWQEYLNTADAEQNKLLDNQLTQELTTSFTALLNSIEQQQLKHLKQAEHKIENLHLQYSVQYNQSLDQQSKLIKQVHDLKQSVAESKSQNNKLQAEFDRVYSQAEQSRHLIDQKEEENRSLWRQLEELTSKLDEQKWVLTEQIVDHKRHHNSESQHHQQIEAKWLAKAKIQDDTISSQNQQIKELKASLNQAEQKLEFANEQLMSDAKKQQYNQEDKAYLSNSLHKEINELTELNTELKQHLESAEQNYKKNQQQLSKQITELTEKNIHLASQLDDKNNLLAATNHNDQSKLEEMTDKIKMLEQRLNTTKSQLLEKEDKLHHLSNEQAYKAEQLKQQHQRALEHEQYQQKMLLEQQYKTDKKLAQLEKELSQQIKLREEANIESRQTLRKQDELITYLQQEVKGQKQQINSQKLQADKLAQQLELTQTKLNQSQADLTHAQKTIQKLKAELDQQLNYQQA
ncbi:hypothetical protein N7931_09475 [Catenovulum sp. 2E275]|uniref:hypothetical protein n=1 Tax=Catenovulum sp. 2E275 TaxID=2980497 RepID=UPI0021D0073F|nr:hypothetical protein [Catenovulum sp. 2E275]MCU4675864.1 hypothetical protein [Catenovulum sp. 2E275]